MRIDYDFMAELAKNYEYQYQVENLYGDMIANNLTRVFGIYVRYDEHSKLFDIDSLGLRIKTSDVKDYSDLEKIIKSNIGDNADEVKLINKFKYIFSDFAVSSKQGEFISYSSHFNSMGFFDLLWYLKTDKFLRDGSKGHELMNVAQDYADKYPNDNTTYFYPRTYLQYQIRYGSWIDMTTVDAKFSGWMVKFFKNGKIQIKGMSDEDWNKIVYIYDICKRK
jgi:hypothetical protein